MQAESGEILSQLVWVFEFGSSLRVEKRQDNEFFPRTASLEAHQKRSTSRALQ